jgi:hypothetical protein
MIAVYTVLLVLKKATVLRPCRQKAVYTVLGPCRQKSVYTVPCPGLKKAVYTVPCPGLKKAVYTVLCPGLKKAVYTVLCPGLKKAVYTVLFDPEELAECGHVHHRLILLLDAKEMHTSKKNCRTAQNQMMMYLLSDNVQRQKWVLGAIILFHLSQLAHRSSLEILRKPVQL